MGEMCKARPDQQWLTLCAFDLMHLNGGDLRAKPLYERRANLAGLFGSVPVQCLYLDQFDDGVKLLSWCPEYRLEGVVSKRRDAPYTSGPTKAWRKIKCVEWKAENSERWRLFEGAS